MPSHSWRSLAWVLALLGTALRNSGRTGRVAHGVVAAADRSRARGRRSERRCAHRSASGSRRAAHSHRLRRRHEHGRTRRRDVRDRHASRGDRARGARDRLGADGRRPGAARPHADQAQARDDELHDSARGRDSSRDGLRMPGGLIVTQEIEQFIRTLVAPFRYTQDFDDLPIPFRAVATDMVAGEMVILDSGDLSEAMRASMAMPGVFSPVTRRRQGVVRRRHDAQPAGRHRPASSARTS